MLGKALFASLLVTSLSAFGADSARCTLDPSSGRPVDFSISKTGVTRIETDYGIVVVTVGERHVDPCPAGGALCFDVGIGMAKSFKHAKQLEGDFVAGTIREQMDSAAKHVSSYAQTTMSFETPAQERLLHLVETSGWGSATKHFSLRCRKP